MLEVIARHGMVLCTGHLSRDEIFTLVDAAVAAGIEQIVVTHPEFPSQNISRGRPGRAGGQGRA